MNRLTRHIVLIEDNPQDIDLTQRAFTRQNISNPLHVAQTGAAARQLIATWQQAEQLPALILLDINLLDANGLDLLAELRECAFTQHVPVVVLSSSHEPDDIDRAYQLGANAYLLKPLDFAALCHMLGAVGRFWGEHNCVNF